MTDNPKLKIAIFLALAVLLSGAWLVPILRAGDIGAGGGNYMLGLMWSPGIAAILTRLISRRNLREEGWMPRRWRVLLLACLLPVA